MPREIYGYCKSLFVVFLFISPQGVCRWFDAVVFAVNSGSFSFFAASNYLPRYSSVHLKWHPYIENSQGVCLYI